MLRDDKPNGDYVSDYPDNNIDEEKRQQMVMLLEELHEIKKYKVETLYTAISLADRYLIQIAKNKMETPCLLTLSIVCILMAAKIEQPIAPSMIRMINLLNAEHGILLKKKDVLTLEEDLVRTLDFSLRKVSAFQFLERYLRLFGIDQRKDLPLREVRMLARNYCQFMQRESRFLKYRQSQMAAAALLFAINFKQSTLVTSILGLAQTPIEELENIIKEEMALYADITCISNHTDSKEETNPDGPLRLWSDTMATLTYLETEDIKSVYEDLVKGLE